MIFGHSGRSIRAHTSARFAQALASSVVVFEGIPWKGTWVYYYAPGAIPEVFLSGTPSTPEHTKHTRAWAFKFHWLYHHKLAWAPHSWILGIPL